MSNLKGQLLFPVHILHALNALQHLRVMHVIGDSTDDEIYSSCEAIAKEINAPKDTLWRAMVALSGSEIVESKKGSGGGYYITDRSLTMTKVKDVLFVLGRELPDNGIDRASDRLNNAVADCLDVTLDEFFK